PRRRHLPRRARPPRGERLRDRADADPRAAARMDGPRAPRRPRTARGGGVAGGRAPARVRLRPDLVRRGGRIGSRRARLRPDAREDGAVRTTRLDGNAIGERVHRTPTFGSRTLSGLTGADVFLKAELFQRTGSFKPRGVFNKLASLSPDEKARGVISISAGNHAQALAFAAAAEGIDALVVMW